MSITLLAVAALLSGQSAPAAQRPGSDLTRDLNSAPPSAVQPQRQEPAPVAPAQTPPAPEAARPQPATSAPAAQTPGADLTRDLNRVPPSAGSPQRPTPVPAPVQTPAQAPVTQAPVTQPPAQAPTAVRPQPSTPAPASPTPARPQASPTPAGPAPSSASPALLTPADIAALPFTLDLPAGVGLSASRSGAEAAVYSVRRGAQVLVMIYAGPSSQFPIYDGQVVQTGGRASVVVTEGGRRLALEHLFQRATAPREIHVWVASPDGADRDLAERIGQSVDAH